eukprot:TRINITY_DN17865_c0_g1_i1.p1 TRINITY_DN17865_c0_g1~~TRINITY_DN17865_c0_g1_i1.p1  ORF type:complete len:402 (+),score=83.31 TRINITY_DN17865_c0_g1_i1:34-1239(+)
MATAALRHLLHDIAGISRDDPVQGAGATSFHLGRRHVHRWHEAPTAFQDNDSEEKTASSSTDATEKEPVELETEDDKDRVECFWKDLELHNQVGRWDSSKESIKWAYDNNLKGQELEIWFPGKTSGGECNDLNNTARGCWFRSKLLNDPSCTAEGRCLHFAAHDGEPKHTYTCPTWIRNKDGMGCKLPKFRWQACPMRFNLMRVDTGIPQEFAEAKAFPCSAEVKPETPAEPHHQYPIGEKQEGPGSPDPEDAAGDAQTVPPQDDGAGVDQGKEPENVGPPKGHCSGATVVSDEPRMIFDLKNNTWYRCNKFMRCEEWDIRKIIDTETPKCGETTCGEKQQCFVHRLSALQSTYQCVKDDEVMVLSDGDDAYKLSIPWPLAAMAPPCHSQRRKQSRIKPFL